MKKSTFFKTLLVAAGLLGGSNAWAEDVYTTVYQRNVTYGDANIWTSADLEDWTTSGTISVNVPTDESAGTYYGLYGTGDATYSAYKSFSTESNAKIKYELTLYTERQYYNSNYTYVQFGDKVRVNWFCQYGGNSGAFYLSTDATSNSSTNTLLINSLATGYHTLVIIFNTALNTVESFTIDGTDYSSNLSGTLTSPGSLNKLTMGFSRGHNGYADKKFGLPIVKVSQCEQEVTEKDYTINYTYGEETITSEGGTSTVGATVLATQTSMWNEGNTTKYFVADNATTSFEITSDGTNVFEVALRLAETINYTVQAVDGEGNALAIDNLASGSVIEGETQMEYWSKYVKVGNQWYETSSPYGKNITSANNPVTYTPSAITYFVEGEEMNGYNAAGTSTSTSYSGGVTGRARANSNWYTAGVEVSGLYTVSFPHTLIANSSASTLSGLYVRDENGSTTLVEENVSLSSNTTYTKENVAIPAGSSFQISKGANNSNYGIDYVTLTLTAVSATIGSTGWTTFASAYPLDLSGIEGATAYYASSVDASSVTMTSTDATVAAGTGLMLKGTAGATVTIPVAASGDALSGNKLVGVTSETALDASGSLYVLVNNGGTAEFQSLASNGATIPAGKAYLNAAAAGAKLRVVFADDATAIKSIAVEAADNAAIYNLSGQRVNAAYKGIVIKNGKKYLNK